MKKLLVLVAAIALITVGVTGCSTGSSNDSSNNNADVVIHNNAKVAITAVYIDKYTTDTQSALGANLLSTPLASGSKVHISLAGGDYSFRLSFEGQDANEYESWSTSNIQTKFTILDKSMPDFYLSDGTYTGTNIYAVSLSFDSGEE